MGDVYSELADLSRLHEEKNHRIAALEAESNGYADLHQDALARIAALEQALKNYGAHADACNAHIGEECSCGFKEALESQP